VSNQYASNDRSGDRDQQDFREGPGGRRFFAAPRVCQFCTDRSAVIDYKSADLLRRYVQEDGKIRPRRQTGACALHQRAIARAVKRARHLALLPYTGDSNR
jgi:small subunit ribosomal protein S18